MIENIRIDYPSAVKRYNHAPHLRLFFFYGSLDDRSSIRAEASEARNPAMDSGWKRFVPANSLSRKLQNGTQARSAPHGVEILDLGILGELVQAVLQRISSSCCSQFVDKAFAGKCHL